MYIIYLRDELPAKQTNVIHKQRLHLMRLFELVNVNVGFTVYSEFVFISVLPFVCFVGSKMYLVTHFIISPVHISWFFRTLLTYTPNEKQNKRQIIRARSKENKHTHTSMRIRNAKTETKALDRIMVIQCQRSQSAKRFHLLAPFIVFLFLGDILPSDPNSCCVEKSIKALIDRLDSTHRRV